MTAISDTGGEAPECCERSMALLRACTNASASVFYRVNRELQGFEYISFNLPAESYNDYMNLFSRYDPLHPRFHDDAKLSYLPISEVETDRNTQQFRRFMDRYGLTDMVEIFFRNDGHIRAGATLIRQGGRFRPADLKELSRVLPYVEFVITTFYLPRLKAEQTGLQARFGLTDREMDILYLLRSGAANKDIANNLQISLATVKTHMQHIFQKTGTSNRTEVLSEVFLGPRSPAPAPG